MQWVRISREYSRALARKCWDMLQDCRFCGGSYAVFMVQKAGGVWAA